MLPLTLKEKFLASVPKSVRMPNDDEIRIYVEWETSIEEGVSPTGTGGTSSPQYPLISLVDVSDKESATSPIIDVLSQEPLNGVAAPQESKTYNNTITDYAITEKDVKAGTGQIRAIVGGVPNVLLVEGADYDFVDTNGDDGLDTVRFRTIGGVRPDHATAFTVDYQSYWPREWKGIEEETAVQVHVHAINLEPGNDAGRITARHHRDDLMRVILTKLKFWAATELEDGLVGYGVPRGRSPIQDFSHLEGRGVLRKGFDITVAYNLREANDERSVMDVPLDPDMTQTTP